MPESLGLKTVGFLGVTSKIVKLYSLRRKAASKSFPWHNMTVFQITSVDSSKLKNWHQRSCFMIHFLYFPTRSFNPFWSALTVMSFLQEKGYAIVSLTNCVVDLQRRLSDDFNQRSC